MKRLLLLLICFLALGATAQTGNKGFLDQVKTVKTGITAGITFDGARFKVLNFDDNSGNIKKGATFKLLNTQMAKDDIGLYNVKIKIVDDNGSGKYNGKIGYVYAASTDLTVDYTTGYVTTTGDGNVKIKKNKHSASAFLDRVATTKTGVTGKVTFSPTASLKSTGFDDLTRVNEGSTFELLNFDMVKDDADLYTIKIKIIDDNGSGKYNGKVGYMYGASTDLSDFMDYSDGVINRALVKNKTVSTYTGDFLDRTPSTFPMVFGRVTFSPDASLKTTGFDDATRVPEGATFELLSRRMIKDNIGLYTIKIKIIDDNGSGLCNGKTGFMYPASTTLTDYTDYTREEVVGGPTLLKDVRLDGNKDLSADDFIDRVATVKTGIKGTVTFAPNASLKSTGFDDDTRVPEGSTFELLNLKMAKDDIGLYTVKIKIIDDHADGTHNGKIGYMYGASTSLSDQMDYTTGRIKDDSNPPAEDMTISEDIMPPGSNSGFLDRIATEKTGVTGKVTFSPTASLKSTGFDDDTRVPEGSTFELLNFKMAKDDIGLYTVKIKIIDDHADGTYNGKTGYMYGASTSLSDQMDYTTGRIKDDSNPPAEDITDSDDVLFVPPGSNSGFLDRLPTEKTGVTGKVTFSPTASLKSTGFDDLVRVNEGATFELVNYRMIKDNIGLYTIKIKIIDDNGSGKYNSRIGYMYPASTTLSDYTDYSREVIDMDQSNVPIDNIVPPPAVDSDNEPVVDQTTVADANDGFLDQIPDEYTGLTGTITFDQISFKKTSFADEEPRLKKGAIIELLSPKIIKDNKIQNLYYIKVQIVNDLGGGTFNKQVGFVYVGSTSFSTFANYSTLEIDITGLINSQTNKQQAKKYLGQVQTQKTGAMGTVTFDGGTLKTKSFSDIEPKLVKGTRIELYGVKMVKDNTALGLHHIKVKVVDGPHKGKIGYMYPSSTSFSNYTDYKEERIKIEDIK